MQKCKKVWNLEMTVAMEQDFDSPELAANQIQPSDKAKVKEITGQRIIFSTVKLLKEDKADGLRSKKDKGVGGSSTGTNQADV
jgi:hypothetical protein